VKWSIGVTDVGLLAHPLGVALEDKLMSDGSPARISVESARPHRAARGEELTAETSSTLR
ncbi:MAG: hypothetical protein ACREMY_11380, partial [bacterium]